MFMRYRTKELAADLLPLNAAAKKIIKEKSIPLRMDFIDTQSEYPDTTPNKPVLVLLHGMGACKEVFQDQIDRFSEYFRVIAIDLPGHGGSMKISKIARLTPEEKSILAEQLYNLPSVIAQIGLTLKNLKVKNACLLGHSIGGHIAYGLAIKYPTLVTCIITNGTPPINMSLPNLRLGFSDWFVDHIVKDWLENPKYYSQEEAENIIRTMDYTEVKGKDARFVKALMDSDPLFRQFLYSTLAKFQHCPELYAGTFVRNNESIPVCFLEGTKDLGILVDSIRKIFDEIISQKQPRSQFHDFPSGHTVFRKYPTEFRQATCEFIQSILSKNNLSLRL